MPTTVANSTITGNSALGGSNAAGQGGGVYNSSTLTLLNDTIASNRVSGTGSTGSDLYNDGGTVTATNTIVSVGTGADNCATANSGTITDGGHNLDSGTSCEFAPASSNKDPKLGALANNGGPTETMALFMGSPAIDAGDDTVCAAVPVSAQDQRGVTRPQGAHCDIGAFEVLVPIPTTTSLSASGTSATCGQTVTLTATVVPGTKGTTATGTVTFKDGGTTLGTATLSGGKATFSTTKLDTGAHTITVVYSGTSTVGTTAGFTSSTSTAVTVTVTGCQGLGGLGSAPSAPQKPQAPQQPSQPQAPSTGNTAGSTSTGNTANTTLTQTTPSGQNSQHTSGLPVLPLMLFAALLVLLSLGGLSARLITRRRSAQS
jgi:hypothetical protein